MGKYFLKYLEKSSSRLSPPSQGMGLPAGLLPAAEEPETEAWSQDKRTLRFPQNRQYFFYKPVSLDSGGFRRETISLQPRNQEQNCFWWHSSSLSHRRWGLCDVALGTDKERRRHHWSQGAGPPPEVFIGCLRGQNDSKLSHLGNLLEKQIMTRLHWTLRQSTI